MAVLPVPPGGTNLSTWLGVAHNADGTLTNAQFVYNVKSYGATGNATTDDTAAIQAAINAATGSAAPATSTRTPAAPVYIPTGTYKISSDLIIRSVQGFRLQGAAQDQVRIMPSGTGFTQAAIFINGSADGVYEGFNIQGDGTEALIDSIRLDGVSASRTDAGCVTNSTTTVANVLAQAYDVGATVTGTGIGTSGTATVVTSTPGTGWTVTPACSASGTVTVTVASLNAASRSTTGNCFRDVRVRGNFIVGISLEGNGSQQCDGTTFENVVISGSQYYANWSSSGNWQAGIALGNGTFANNYDHRAIGLDVTGCYIGYKINASSLALAGAQPANNALDFWILPGSQCTITNVQSQNAGQFLAGQPAFAAAPVTFSDIEIKTSYLNSSLVVAQTYGGLWRFTNFAATNVQYSAAWVSGLMKFLGSTSNRPAEVHLANVALNGLKTACILPTAAQANITVTNYANYNVSTGNYTTTAGDLLSAYTGSAWINLDQAILPATSPSLTSVAVSGLTGAVAGTRLAGGTASGAPTTGTFLTGDVVPDQSGSIWVCTAGGTPGTWSGPTVTAPNVQFFTAGGTWTKPGGAKTVFSAVLGGGGGGGSGASGTSGTVQCGGGGGGGGTYTSRQFVASDLGSTVAVSVGAGGTGGASVTGSSGNTTGNPGGVGTVSTFGTYLYGSVGTGGAGGSITAATGGSGPIGGPGTGGAGASASSTGGAGVGNNPASFGSAGAPSGGGITTGAVAGAGAAGSHSYLAYDAAPGVAGAVGGASPTSGTASALANGSCGPSPGSGAASATAAAQAGANALANSGAGGAGGGASLNTFASGAGGNGGSGWVLVITYFQ